MQNIILFMSAFAEVKLLHFGLYRAKSGMVPPDVLMKVKFISFLGLSCQVIFTTMHTQLPLT